MNSLKIENCEEFAAYLKTYVSSQLFQNGVEKKYNGKFSWTSRSMKHLYNCKHLNIEEESIPYENIFFDRRLL